MRGLTIAARSCLLTGLALMIAYWATGEGALQAAAIAMVAAAAWNAALGLAWRTRAMYREGLERIIGEDEEDPQWSLRTRELYDAAGVRPSFRPVYGPAGENGVRPVIDVETRWAPLEKTLAVPVPERQLWLLTSRYEDLRRSPVFTDQGTGVTALFEGLRRLQASIARTAARMAPGHMPECDCSECD